ncbi:hypothetical protein DPMN_107877 [Dreissena polymorpha]|uniref:Uncharacterized protein n=1 Tax=Dreissena polymorpha TaxID=45954 RepID=A0A9D4K7I2_DREPO|nr:hypothetical protein DPMN_107877 [Dreissena polymorpha]
MVTKTVLLSKILHTRDEDKHVNPSMSFNEEKNDHAKMMTVKKAGMIALISTPLT